MNAIAIARASRLLAALSGLGLLGCASASITLWRRVPRAGPTAVTEPTASLSLIVPLKGADAHTETHLEALVASRVPGAVEYLFVMESTADPAYTLCRRVQARYPDRDIHVLLSGPAGGRMGKQHNLAVGARAARYDVLGSMDADVQVDSDTLAAALARLADPRVGAAYLLPIYRGPGPLGGKLVALYANYYYTLNMAALALRRPAPFIIGGLWLMPRAALERIGGLEQFGATVSDDAAIGRALVRVGLPPVPVARTVGMPLESLDLRGGMRHLLKWLTLLRTEGLPTYLTIAALWHPVLWAVCAALSRVAARRPPGRIAHHLGLVGVAAATRLASVALLNRRVYGIAGWEWPLAAVAYEVLAVPALFGIGLFRHVIVWRGRRYHLGAHGHIADVADLAAPHETMKERGHPGR